MKAAIVLCALALPLAASADEVYLRSGGRLSGVVVERRADGIVIDVGPGRVTLPAALVTRVVEGTPAFAVFRERSGRLADADVMGWLALGAWARDRDLSTQSAQAFEHVLAIDPGNPVAHRELGHVVVEGRWMTPAEGYRARGYVYFEGSWVMPEERAAMLAERAAAAQARQSELEAQARVREAEARARAAEAEARRAEAAVAPSQGIPLAMAYGGYPYGGYPYGYGPVLIGGYGAVGRFRSGGNGWLGGQGHLHGPGCGPGHTPGMTSPPLPPPAPAPQQAPVSAHPIPVMRSDVRGIGHN
jgi:hypothetical protein